MGKHDRLAMLMCALISLGMLMGAAVEVYSTLAFRAGALSARGTVVDRERMFPVVEFVDRDGSLHQVVGLVGAKHWLSHDIGERVTVRYRPGQPENARIDGCVQSWSTPALFLWGGFCFGLPPMHRLLSRTRRRRRRRRRRRSARRTATGFTSR